MLPEIKSDIYFDNNATTMLLPAVIEEIERVLRTPYGNPSSAHSYGDFSREIIENARQNVALLLNCRAEQIVFTSGATEANYAVFQKIIQSGDSNGCIVTTPVEHSSIKENCNHLRYKGFEVIELDITSDGIVCLEQLKKLVEEKEVALVTIGWANNETGVIQPIDKIVRICNESRILFHTDASQYIGRGEVDLSASGIDYLSFTGHKLHAPKGIGVLYIKTREQFLPVFHGGEQEHGLRAGTENLIGIAGLGKAIEIRKDSFDDSIDKLESLRDYFENILLKEITNIEINSNNAIRTPNTSNIRFREIDGRALVAQLDIAGLYCSQTSACTSMIPEPSAVLRAMGLSVEEAFASIRFSFAVDNNIEEVDRAVSLIKEKVEVIRRFYAIRGDI